MWQDYNFSVRDGTSLYGRRYSSGHSSRRPLLCLSALGGNSAHFDALARSLSAAGPEQRDVYALDFHGRGRSARGGARRDISLLADAEDALDFMTLTGLKQAVLLGSGHGGQVAMVMAVLRPAGFSGLVLNDAAPEFEPAAVARVVGEIASLPLPASFADAAHMLRLMHGATYPRLLAEDWLELAQAQYPDLNGKPGRPYDPALARYYSLTGSGEAQLSLWSQFAALRRLPVLALRGELSHMVADATVARMAELHPRLEVAKVVGEGHPPLLRDRASIGVIGQFLTRGEYRHHRSEPQLKAAAA
jgi:pimeloyl-ACP methyl ester carboxylesterase